MSKNSLIKISFWDWEAKSFEVCVRKIEASANFVGIGGALDPILMENRPTQSEFVALGVTRPDNLTLVDLYEMNKKLCMIIVLSQGESHRMVHRSKTKSDDYPNGIA
jgi:hypothetical protein